MAEQAQRQLSITSPLGKDVLLLTRIEGEEGLSTPFRFTLQLLSEKRDIKPEDLVGKKVTFSIKLADGKPRFFHGFVSRLRAGRGDTRYRHYTAEVVSWLGLLAHTNDCRIFQNKTVLEIIEAVFGDHKFAEFKTNQVSKRGPTAVLERKLEYCVQYRESDLNFVSRLMEENGVHYYFTHEEGKHTLVLTDSKNNYPWCTEKEVEYVAGTAGTASADGISEWTHDFEIRPSAWAYSDYDFKNPKTKQLGTVSTLPSNNLPGRPSELELEVFDYPGDYVKPAEGKQLVELRMGEEEARYNTVKGASACRSFVTGGKFKFKDPDQPDEDGKTYVLSKIIHEANEPAEYESGAGGAGLVYQNEFECIPDSLDFRPPRVARRPFVQGPQTAVVTGPGGADVYPDEYGRVKVQFFWDRYGKNDDNSSCWLRVSQTWAGNTWGSMHIPWVGQEVIVDFLEGNPDRPIITGRVYNGDQKVPLNLPAQKYENVVARDEFGNEIVFVHVPGDEHIRIHSPHHNSRLELGRSKTWTTKSDSTDVTVGNYNTISYGKVTASVYGSETKSIIGGNYAFVGGFVGDAWIGGKLQFCLGSLTNIQIAGVTDMTVGYCVKYARGPEMSMHDEGFTQVTDKNAVLDSNAKIGLLAGKQKKSKLVMGDTAIELTHDSSASVPTQTGPWAKTRMGIGIAISVVGALNAKYRATKAAVEACRDATKDFPDGPANPDPKATVPPETIAKQFGAQSVESESETISKLTQVQLAGVVGLGLSLLSGVDDDPAPHSLPDSKLVLEKDQADMACGKNGSNYGHVRIDNSGEVQLLHETGKNYVFLKPDGEIGLQTPKTIWLEADDVKFKGGSITHKNIKVNS